MFGRKKKPKDDGKNPLPPLSRETTCILCGKRTRKPICDECWEKERDKKRK